MSLKTLLAHSTSRLESLARSKYLFLIFFATAAVVFSSFFLSGEVLLASTDNLFNHYPNLIYGLRALHNGDFGLWNPYIFAGTDFTTSMHHHILHPINWVLALFPEKYLFHALTLKAFLEVSFVGYFAFRIFSLYQHETWAALLLAVVAQLGGFTWFTLTTFIGSHLFLVSLIAIYLIVTYESRRRVVTFVLLSLCFFDILMMGHVGYIFSFGVPIIVVFAAKTWPNCVLRSWTGLTPAFVAGGCIGVVLASPRLFAITHGLIYEGVVVQNMWLPSLIGNTGYFVLTGFIPEIMGIHFGDSVAISQALNIGVRHTQFHNFLYFGITSVIFIYLSLLGVLGTRVFILAILALFVTITPLYLIQPVSDIFNVLLFPMIHDIVPRTWTAFLIFTTLALALHESANDRAKPSEAVMRWFTLVIGVVVAMSITMGVKVLHESISVIGPEKWSVVFLGARLAVFAALAVPAWMIWKLRFDVDTTRRLSNVAAFVFLIVTLGSAVVAYKLQLFFSQWLVLRGFIYTLGAAIWSLVILSLARSANGENDKSALYSCMTIAGVVGVVIMLLFPIPEALAQRGIDGNMLAAIMGIFKFILLAFVFIELIVRWTSGRIKRQLFLVLITLFTVGDLLFFTKFYSHVGASPFVSAQSIYPPITVPGSKAEIVAWRESGSLPNLLVNPRLKKSDAAVQDWILGGSKVNLVSNVVARGGSDGVTFVAMAEDGGTLFQDVSNIGGSKTVSFGAWVRLGEPNKVSLLLTNMGNGRQSVFHTGSGKWEWLSVTIDSRSGIETARAHIAISGRGEAAVIGPRLVRGSVVKPDTRPDGDINKTRELDRAENRPPLVDLSQYRTNNPNSVIGRHFSEFSNIPMVYGLPTYGGVDSDVNRYLVAIISAFEPDNAKWVARIGVVPLSTNQRLLDLFGVKYDFAKDGSMSVRPNALARLSLFSNYEVLDDPNAVIRRLKQKSFDPDTTVLIEHDPGWSAGADRVSHRFQPVTYRSPTTSHIEADIDLVHPAILLFNDSYSLFWHASFNGKELQIIKANGNFMAVCLPPGRGILMLRFVPEPFLALVRVSLAVAFILMAVAVYIVATAFRQNGKTLVA